MLDGASLFTLVLINHSKAPLLTKLSHETCLIDILCNHGNSAYSCNSNSRAPSPIKMAVAGGDAYINCVLRPYVEQFSAKSPDWQHYVKFLIIPLGMLWIFTMYYNTMSSYNIGSYSVLVRFPLDKLVVSQNVDITSYSCVMYNCCCSIPRHFVLQKQAPTLSAGTSPRWMPRIIPTSTTPHGKKRLRNPIILVDQVCVLFC